MTTFIKHRNGRYLKETIGEKVKNKIVPLSTGLCENLRTVS